VQWDTSEHDWLEGRGGGLYPILMIDAATSSLQAWFVRSDSSEESLLLLSKCLDQNGRPLAFYTDEHLRTSKSTAKAMRRVFRGRLRRLPGLRCQFARSRTFPRNRER